MNEKDRVAQFYVNGPFRQGRDDHGYDVTYNFNIHIPRDTELRLRNANGEIKTNQTGGRFDIAGVNGPVSMTAASGSGSVHTVNGRLTVAFRENPKAAVDFKTVNGAIEASFPPGLSADLRFKTLNGPVYTDFDTTLLAKVERHSNVRVGAGGPELKFETVNGEIRIKKEASK